MTDKLMVLRIVTPLSHDFSLIRGILDKNRGNPEPISLNGT